MRAILAATLALLSASAHAQQFMGYEGPKAMRSRADRAYQQLQQDCPRLKQAGRDIKEYSLHVGTPEMQGDYGKAARAYEAYFIVIVTVKTVAAPHFIPAFVIPPDRFFNIPLIVSAEFSGVMANNPAALWICEKTAAPDTPIALVPSPGLRDLRQ